MSSLYTLRNLLWLYLVLLLTEGALRKWILPQLDQPLLIIRDPLVVLIYWKALQEGYSFRSVFFLPNLLLAVICAVTSTMFGIGSIAITAYGLRTDFLQVPLIFLMPQILNRDDVILMGKFILLAAGPMAAIALLQFLSPPDSFLNKGAFLTHFDSVRPSGTFSYISGLSTFFALASAFLFYGFIEGGTYKLWVMLIGTFSILAAAGCSGSRTCLSLIGMVAVVAIICVITTGKGGTSLLIAGALIGLAVLILSNTAVFKKGTEQMQARLAESSAAEEDQGGFLGRFFNTMFKPLSALDRLPPFGYGLGIGTNAGQSMAKNPDLPWIEEEWDRLTFECGPFFGLLLCVFRACLMFTVLFQSIAAYRRNNLLPLLLFAGTGILLLNGQWGVPTTLGFACFGAGLMLSACNEPEEYDDEELDEEGGELHSEPADLPAAQSGSDNASS
jgi:hypothetical protein